MSPEFSYPEASATNHEILIEGFKKDCAIRGMADGSIPRYLSVIKIFCNFLVEYGLNLCGADRDVLRDFLEYLRLERHASHKTVENYFTVLSSLFECLAYEGYVAANPVLPVRKRYLKRYKDNVKARCANLSQRKRWLGSSILLLT